MSKLQKSLVKLEPSRNQNKSNFEQLIKELLQKLTGYHFYLAKSGSQEGRDISSHPPQGNIIYVECKRYGNSTTLDKRELLGEISESSSSSPDLWVLTTTSTRLNSQLHTALSSEARQRGMEFLPILLFGEQWFEIGEGGYSLEVLLAFDSSRTLQYLQDVGISKQEINDIGNELTNIQNHPSFQNQVERIRQSLTSPFILYHPTRNEVNSALLEKLSSREEARSNFKQTLDIRNSETLFIKRQGLLEQMNDWYSQWSQKQNMLIVLGEEGDGKTWGVMNWIVDQLEQKQNFPLVLFIPSVNANSTNPIELIINHIKDFSNFRDKNFLETKIERWLKHWNEEKPAILLVLDGINERYSYQGWRELLEALCCSPYNHSIGVIITCRTQYWKDYPLLNSRKNTQFELSPFNDIELEEALQKSGLECSEMSDELVTLIRKPRYFTLAAKYSNQLENSEDFTIARLIYEDWKDRYERKLSYPAPAKFENFIATLAENKLQSMREKGETRISIINISDIPDYDTSQILNEICTSGILSKKCSNKYQVSEEHLIYGFSLLLVDDVVEKNSEEEINLNEAIADWFDPNPEMDIKAKIYHMAALIALEGEKSEVPLKVKVAFLDAWVNSHNPSEKTARDFRAYLPRCPEAYTDLAELVWSGPSNNAWAQELIMHSFLYWIVDQKDQRVKDKLIPAIKKYLCILPLYGFPTLRQAYKNENEFKNVICERLGFVPQENPIKFLGYHLFATGDDYLIQMTRFAIGVISYWPREEFIEGLATACVIETLVGYLDYYKNKADLFRWIFKTAPESTWKLVKSQVEYLLIQDSPIAQHTARDLLYYEGSKDAYELLQTIPSVVPPSPLTEEIQQDPCHQYNWREQDCQTCSDRTDLPLQWIAKQLKKHCLNPELQVSNNLGQRLQNLINSISSESIWSSQWQERSDILYKQYEPALCVYAPESLAEFIKQVVQNSLFRTLNEVPLNLWTNLEKHSILYGEEEIQIFTEVWCRVKLFQEFISEMDLNISGNWFLLTFLKWQAPQRLTYLYLYILQLQKNNLDKDSLQLIEARLFFFVLQSLNPEQQLNYLISRVDDASDWLMLAQQFKTPTNLKFAINALSQVKSITEVNRILWFITSHCQCLSESDLLESIFPLLQSNGNSFTKALVMQIIYQSGHSKVIEQFFEKGWQWNLNHSFVENHWGSLLFCKYADHIVLSRLEQFIHPAYISYAFQERGLQSEDIQQVTNHFIHYHQNLKQSPAFPDDFPEIELLLSKGNEMTEGDMYRLDQGYFSSNITSMSPDSTWGGYKRTFIRSSPRNKRNQGHLLEVNFTSDEEIKHLREISIDFEKTQLEYGNWYFCRRVPLRALREVIKNNPDLINEWLQPIKSSSITPIDNRRIVQLGITFYLSLFRALIQQEDGRALELYEYLRKLDSIITPRDAETEIRDLDFALFEAQPNGEIEKVWKGRFEASESDCEILLLAVSAQRNSHTQWLISYVKEHLLSTVPLDFTRAVTLLGFIEDDRAYELLEERKEIEPNTWRGKLVEISLNRWLKNKWAKHWFRRFLCADNNLDAWRSFRVFSYCVDRRFWLWRDKLIQEFYDLSQQRLKFLKLNENTIRNSLSENEKDFRKRLFGENVMRGQVSPWLKVDLDLKFLEEGSSERSYQEYY